MPDSQDPINVSVSGALPRIKATAKAKYSDDVPRYISGGAKTMWQETKDTDFYLKSRWQITELDRVYHKSPWEKGRPSYREVFSSIYQLPNIQNKKSIPWEDGTQVETIYSVVDESAIFVKSQKGIPWDEGISVSTSPPDFYWIELDSLFIGRQVPWEEAVFISRNYLLPSGVGRGLEKSTRIPWEIGQLVTQVFGEWSKNVLPPPVEIPKEYKLALLNFQCRYPQLPVKFARLNFGDNPCPPLVDISTEVIFIVNNILVTRVSDGAPIETYSVSIGTDWDSWCWSMNAKIAPQELDKVAPKPEGPVEIEVTLNGVSWRFLVEEYDQSREFGKTEVSIRGRSLTAYLDSPYAPTRTHTPPGAITARQLAEQELERPGLVTGFNLDWVFGTSVPELGWQIPQDTWSYSNLTPIGVINAIVGGAGGFVNSHPSEKKLIVRPRYPYPYWQWNSQEVRNYIPLNVIKRQNFKWLEKPNFNGVFVSGENTGVIAHVKRSGTAGDFLAQDYTSPFISDLDAARLKGTEILSSGGKQAQISILMPMGSEQTPQGGVSSGVITPGNLVAVIESGFTNNPDWRGLVTSVSIEASSNGGAITINQTLGIERHYVP